MQNRQIKPHVLTHCLKRPMYVDGITHMWHDKKTKNKNYSIQVQKCSFVHLNQSAWLN